MSENIHMDLSKINSDLNILQMTCSICRVNIIYVKFSGTDNKTTPYMPSQFTCLECNQGLLKNDTQQP